MDFPSSPNVGPAKRSFDDELQESPTANRAKRARPNKKDRSMMAKQSNGSVEQDDLGSPNKITSTGVARKETPIYPPLPFPLKEAPKVHVSKSEKAQNSELKKNKRRERKRKLEKGLESPKNSEPEDNEVKKNEAKAREDADNGGARPTALGYLKTQANTRKIRGEASSELNQPISNWTSQSSATAGPSRTKTSKKVPVYESKDLTPLSDFALPRDYTFKAYPNPIPSIKQSQPPKHNKEDNNTAKSPPNTITNMDMDTNPSPATPPALTTPSGTKTLKSINKQLRALSAHLTATPTPTPNNNNTPNNTNIDIPLHPAYKHEQQHAVTAVIKEEVANLRSDIARLHERLDRDGLRAATRHTMLFNALVKVAGDIGALRCSAENTQQEGVGMDREGEGTGVGGGGGASGGGTPRAGSAAAQATQAREVREKLSRSMLQSRKTLEQCLAIYTEDMDRAGTREEVVKYGGLAVQYAGDLFKTLG